MRRPQNTQAGFTLLEVALVLIITAMVIGGLWLLSADLIYTQNVNQLEKGLSTTLARIRNFYGDRSMANDNTIMTNTNLLQLSLIAPEIIKGNNNIAHNLAPNGTGTIVFATPGDCAPYFTPSAQAPVTWLEKMRGRLMAHGIMPRENRQTNAKLIPVSNCLPGYSMGNGGICICPSGQTCGGGTDPITGPGAPISGGSTTTGNSGFSVTLNNMSAKACDQIVPRLAGTRGQAQAMGIVAVLVGGANVLDYNGNQYDLNASTLQSSCQDGVTVELCLQQF